MIELDRKIDKTKVIMKNTQDIRKDVGNLSKKVEDLIEVAKKVLDAIYQLYDLDSAAYKFSMDQAERYEEEMEEDSAIRKRKELMEKYGIDD